MDVTRVPQTPPIRPSPSAGDMQVIDLKQIKTILYLGLRGEFKAPRTLREHAVDTFA